MLQQNVISFATKTTAHWGNRWIQNDLSITPLTLLDCFELEWEELETNLRNYLLWKNELDELVYEKIEEKFSALGADIRRESN